MAAENEYIRYAMDSLVGVYIFDYTSAPLVREHTNTSFDLADTRLEELLNRPHLSADEVNETITIMILLAMQDVSLPLSFQRVLLDLTSIIGGICGKAQAL